MSRVLVALTMLVAFVYNPNWKVIMFSLLISWLFVRTDAACCPFIVLEDLIAYSGSEINGIYELQNDSHENHAYYKQALD